jgi:hypothetical protein
MPLCRSPTFLVQASQHLWLVCRNGVYQRFTSVSHTINLSPLTALMLAVSISPHGSIVLFRERVHCPESFLPQDCS